MNKSELDVVSISLSRLIDWMFLGGQPFENVDLC